GADARKSAGNGRLVYAMRISEKLTREEYYANARFARKKPLMNGTYARTRGDNLKPTNDFERREQFSLISWQFFYFGGNAIRIPKRLSKIEKRGPGFKKLFDPTYVTSFVKWLEKTCKPGKQGEPYQSILQGCRTCKSSC